jgi:hypothetical protein
VPPDHHAARRRSSALLCQLASSPPSLARPAPDFVILDPGCLPSLLASSYTHLLHSSVLRFSASPQATRCACSPDGSPLPFKGYVRRDARFYVALPGELAREMKRQFPAGLLREKSRRCSYMRKAAEELRKLSIISRHLRIDEPYPVSQNEALYAVARGALQCPGEPVTHTSRRAEGPTWRGSRRRHPSRRDPVARGDGCPCSMAEGGVTGAPSRQAPLPQATGR